MATYFHSSNNERDAAPMLYLRETWPSSNSESPVIPGNMMMYMNYSSSSGSCTDALAGNSQQQQNSCSEIPTVGASVSTPSRQQQEILSNLGGSRIGEQDFSGWGNGRNEVPFMHLMGQASGIQGVQNLQGQGLSLSLSPQIPAALQLSSMEYRNPNSCFSSFLSPNLSISGEESGRSASFRDNENSQNKQMRNVEYMLPGFLGGNADSMKMDLSPYGMSSVTRTIPNSKYLRAAQQLLDEVVNVQKALKQKDSKKDQTKSSKELDGGSEKETTLPPVSATSSNPQEPINNPPTELSAAERQDLQNKLAKLLSMLDEVRPVLFKVFHSFISLVFFFSSLKFGSSTFFFFFSSFFFLNNL